MENTSQKSTILVVDDEVSLLRSLSATILKAGYPEPAVVSDSSRALDILTRKSFQVAVLDLRMPSPDGLEILAWLKERHPMTECIILTALDDVTSAVTAIKAGAYDYMVKPVDSDKFLLTLRRAVEKYELSRRIYELENPVGFEGLKSPEAFEEMVAQDDKMAAIFHMIERIAPTDYHVLIVGESGTGKEMVARIIHRLSKRTDTPFKALNIAGLTPSLFEDELFGHIKGAFTGASGSKKGFFLSANGGTLFLDEITEIDTVFQAKLLRAIQEGNVYPLGSTDPIEFDTRIIAATNRNILEEVEYGRFRADLFYRLNTCTIHIPPLRDRKNDIAPLAHHFLRKHLVGDKSISGIEPKAMEILQGYEFPGNVRELESIIASAVLGEKNSALSSDAIAPHLLGTMKKHQAKPIARLEEVIKTHILDTLVRMNGNRADTADALGIGLRTLYRKLKEYQTGHNGDRMN